MWGLTCTHAGLHRHNGLGVKGTKDETIVSSDLQDTKFNQTN